MQFRLEHKIGLSCEITSFLLVIYTTCTFVHMHTQNYNPVWTDFLSDIFAVSELSIHADPPVLKSGETGLFHIQLSVKCMVGGGCPGAATHPTEAFPVHFNLLMQVIRI